MKANTVEIISGVLVSFTILYPFALLIILQIKYSKIIDFSKKRNLKFKENLGGLLGSNKGGTSIGGTFYFRTPLPIDTKTHNSELKKLIDNHNKFIKLFWVSTLSILLTVIIVLNLIN